MIVMKYYENGNLYQYLDHCNGFLSWRDMIDMLWGIAGGLERIHSEGKVHGNLHGGNLLIEDEKVSTDARIGDVGLHGPCNDDKNRRANQIYGHVIIRIILAFFFLKKKWKNHTNKEISLFRKN
jgi:serine/threonine protein kinase